MYSTQVYLYQQITEVLLIDTADGETFTYRYNPVYAKTLTINLAVDNVLLFQFVNQEEKPVNITNGNLVFRLLNQAGTEILLQEPMVILNAALGRAKVTIPSTHLTDIVAQPASYSITFQNSPLIQPVFTDAQSGSRAPVNIVNSVLPQFLPSVPLTIPTLELTSQAQPGDYAWENAGWTGWNGDGNGWGDGAAFYNSLANTEYYSSFIEPKGPITTIQMDLIGYTGTIKVQGAQNYEATWYNITESTTYYNETKTIYMNVLGWHPILRMCFNNSIFATPAPVGPGQPATAVAACVNGEIQSITILNGGQGYLAPPNIQILGNGSGATAEAEIENGVVTAINITNPGSGYWPVPIQGYTNNSMPPSVPPDEQGAVVAITTGFVTNIYYR